MLLSIPTRIDLRGPIEKRANIANMRKRLRAYRYMRENRLVRFLMNS